MFSTKANVTIPATKAGADVTGAEWQTVPAKMAAPKKAVDTKSVSDVKPQETADEMLSRFVRVVDTHKTVKCSVSTCNRHHNPRTCTRWHNSTDRRPNIWDNWTDPRDGCSANKVIMSYNPSVYKTIKCNHPQGKCPFGDNCGFSHIGEPVLKRRYGGPVDRDSWIADTKDSIYAMFETKPKDVGSISQGLACIACSPEPKPEPKPELKLNPEPKTVSYGVDVGKYEIGALSAFPVLLDEMNKSTELVSLGVSVSSGNMLAPDGNVKECVVLSSFSQSLVTFGVASAFVCKTLRSLGPQREFNKTFNFNCDSTQNEAIDCMKRYGQKGFGWDESHVILTITDDKMAHLRILKNTDTYNKGIHLVIRKVLNCNSF